MGGVADPLGVAGQRGRGQRAAVTVEAVPDRRGVLVDQREQAGPGRGGSEAGGTDRGGEQGQVGARRAHGGPGGDLGVRHSHEDRG